MIGRIAWKRATALVALGAVVLTCAWGCSSRSDGTSSPIRYKDRMMQPEKTSSR